MEYFSKIVAYFKAPGIHESCRALSKFCGVFQYCADRYLNRPNPVFSPQNSLRQSSTTKILVFILFFAHFFVSLHLISRMSLGGGGDWDF